MAFEGLDTTENRKRGQVWVLKEEAVDQGLKDESGPADG